LLLRSLSGRFNFLMRFCGQMMVDLLIDPGFREDAIMEICFSDNGSDLEDSEIVKVLLEKVAEEDMLYIDSKKWDEIMVPEKISLVKEIFVDDNHISVDEFIDRFKSFNGNLVDDKMEDLIYVDGKPIDMNMIDMEGNIQDKNGKIVGKVNLKDLSKFNNNIPEIDEEEPFDVNPGTKKTKSQTRNKSKRK